MVAGVFDLNSPKDLLNKLRHDYQLMEDHPFDSYLAFNFFVTAEAMLDWIYPGQTNNPNRRNLRNSEILLQITSHIASGAKHFSHLSSHHNSLTDTTPTAGYFSNYFPKGYFPPGYFGDGVLLIRLDGDAEMKYGKKITALKLAKEVLEYWDMSNLIK